MTTIPSLTLPQAGAGEVPTDGHLAPDLPRLIAWLTSWVQQSGAIHGFHNHSVWGGNPYRFGDFTAGHSTFASLLLPVLARLDAQGTEGMANFLERALAFQLDDRQSNGEFAHIGFQVGESLACGLIHNMVPCIALLLTLEELAPGRRQRFGHRILSVVSEVMGACDVYGKRTTPDSCANQEYARQWVRLVLADATGRAGLREAALADLELLGARFFIRGLPDQESFGVLRMATNPDFIEPAEYYGLMIEPLLLAHERTGNPEWLEQATGLARHIAGSSWVDAAGMRRFHRLYYRTPDGRYTRTCEPMLIAGMGLTLEAVRKCARRIADTALESFVSDCHRTLAHYQHPAGFFLSATGWNNEADIVPCPAWHSHDAWHLLMSRDDNGVNISGPESTFSLVLEESCFYAECGPHWHIGDYLTQDTFALLGRKDEIRFGRDMTWIGGPRALPDHYRFPHSVSILKTDRSFICCRPLPNGCHIMNASSLPLEVSGFLKA